MFDRETAPSEEIDVAEEAHVAWIRSQRDASLWHQATMAAVARSDPHDFIPWVLTQPELDRATAGWLFLWPEGSRYLRGERDFPLNISSERMLAIFRAVCERSESVGFANDFIGLDPDFEPERLRTLDVVARGEVSAGLIVPRVLLDRPFPPERPEKRFVLDDGLLLLSDDMIALLT
jgi:hypothetical protein